MIKKKPTTTINVDAVKRDAKKVGEKISQSNPEHFGKELAPGTVKRESPLEQEMGSGKYRQMIHEHNDKNKHILDRLPFTFPKKKTVRSHLDIMVDCAECGYSHVGSEHTVGFICPKCEKYVSVKNPEAEARGYDPELVVGFRGTASDRLRMKEERHRKKNQ